MWTDHALERARRRGLSQSEIVAVLRHPDKTFPGKKLDSVKFIRTINGRRIHAVAALNEERKWILMSVWVRGEEDRWGFPERYVYQFVGWVGRGLRELLLGKKS